MSINTWGETLNSWDGGVDTTAPVITINPATLTYNLTVDDTFTPPVGTSTDAVDGTKTITPTGSVDDNAVGTYTLTYSDTDSAGNVATPVIVTVYVSAAIDTTAPVITLNGSEVVTIEAGSTYVDAGATTDDGSTVIVTGSVNTNIGGIYYYYYNATDAAGNAAEPVTRTINVQADVVKPVITLSPNQTVFSIKQGDSFTPPIGTSTDGVDGVKTITPTGTVDVNTVDTYTLTYTDTDTAGNAATPVVVTVEVTDGIAPVIMVSGSETTTIERGQKIPTFTAVTDDGSTVIVGGDMVDNMDVGSYTITFNATDTAGNISTEVIRTVVVSAGVMETLYQNTVGTTDKPDQIWQHSDNFWFVPVGSPETFIGAEYIISDTMGNILLSADLGDHVITTTGGFLIKLSDLLITFSGICNHQFTLTDSLGNKRPPEFFRRAFVNKTVLNK